MLGHIDSQPGDTGRAMSQENVELTRRILNAVNEGGLTAAAADHFHPEITWHTDPLVPEAGVYVGREAVLAYLQGYLRAIGDTQFEVHDVVDLGNDKVLAVTTFSGQPAGAAEGQTSFIDWCLISRFEDRRVIELHSFLDKARAYDAAGLSE